MLLRARMVLPMSGPPIENGAVRTRADVIETVGPWKDFESEPGEALFDLGEVMLLPGLINAHCHLDYTDMAGLIPAQKRFADWIKAIVALKGSWGYSEFAQSWVHGARMLLASGVTTVADVEAVPELLPDAWQLGPLRVISFREMISLKWDADAERRFDAQVEAWAHLPHVCAGLSPHAPYTTTPDLLRRAAAVSREKQWLLMTHLAESEEELRMFRDSAGPLFDWLAPQRTAPPRRCTPVEYAEDCGYLGDNLLAVHANYLEGNDVPTLARHNVSIVHCPRSHAYFGHRRFAYQELARAGLNICLGTDSLASVRKTRNQPVRLSLFDEMRTFARLHPDVEPLGILEMATLNGARALKQPGRLGELTPGAKADLIAIPCDGIEAALNFEGEVTTSMIDGRWATAP